MRSTYCLLAVVLCVAMTSHPSHARLVRYSVERHEKIHNLTIGSLTCTCDNNTESTLNISRSIGNAIISEDLKDETCSEPVDNETAEICQRLSHCRNCSLLFEECFLPDGKKNNSSHCIRETYDVTEKYFRDEEDHDAPARKKRQASECPFPKSMKNSDIFCRISVPKTVCIQTCILGYTLKGTTTQNRTCRTKVPKVWKPSGFEECQPYVDCTLSLVSPGSFNCVTASTSNYPDCRVKCDDYEDIGNSPRKNYVCNDKGEWDMQLPHCVIKGSNIQLTKRRRITYK